MKRYPAGHSPRNETVPCGTKTGTHRDAKRYPAGHGRDQIPGVPLGLTVTSTVGTRPARPPFFQDQVGGDDRKPLCDRVGLLEDHLLRPLKEGPNLLADCVGILIAADAPLEEFTRSVAVLDQLQLNVLEEKPPLLANGLCFLVEPDQASRATQKALVGDLPYGARDGQLSGDRAQRYRRLIGPAAWGAGPAQLAVCLENRHPGGHLPTARVNRLVGGLLAGAFRGRELSSSDKRWRRFGVLAAYWGVGQSCARTTSTPAATKPPQHCYATVVHTSISLIGLGRARTRAYAARNLGMDCSSRKREVTLASRGAGTDAQGRGVDRQLPARPSPASSEVTPAQARLGMAIWASPFVVIVVLALQLHVGLPSSGLGLSGVHGVLTQIANSVANNLTNHLGFGGGG